jgi:hypothetical protein
MLKLARTRQIASSDIAQYRAVSTRISPAATHKSSRLWPQRHIGAI